MLQISGRVGSASDLGTANTLVTRRGQGIVINQPTVLAFRNNESQQNEMIAVGQEAKEMLARAPQGVEVVAPIQEGVISNFKVAKILMEYLVRCSHGENRLVKTHAVLGVPACASEIERRALQEVAEMANLGKIHFIQETIAAALGAGINIMNSKAIWSLISAEEQQMLP